MDDRAKLNAAIEAVGLALSAIPPEHPIRAELLGDLAMAFRARFQHSSELADLDAGIEASREAVYVTALGDRRRGAYLDVLAALLLQKFELVGHLSDLDAAIRATQQAVDTTPPGAPDRTRRWRTSGSFCGRA